MFSSKKDEAEFLAANVVGLYKIDMDKFYIELDKLLSFLIHDIPDDDYTPIFIMKSLMTDLRLRFNPSLLKMWPEFASRFQDRILG